MQTNRHNIYVNIHKAIRAELGRVLVIAGRADCTDIGERVALVDQFLALANLLEDHTHHEDRHVMPLVAQASPDVERLLAQAHPRLDAAVTGLRAQALALGTDAAGGYAFYLALASFVGEYFLHIADEELKANPALWARFSDAELIAAEQRIIADIRPDRFLVVFKAMLPNMDRFGRRAMFAGMRMGMPTEAFDDLVRYAGGVLDSKDLEQLVSDLAAAA